MAQAAKITARAVAGRVWTAALVACLLGAVPHAARAGEVTLAVAANFAKPVGEIAAAFAEKTGHIPRISIGSTGQLYAQIGQGAPFDVYLAADQARPARAVEEGLAVPGSRLTYALGRLVLYSREPGLVSGPQALSGPGPLAIANPKTAPYGAAAMEVLAALAPDPRPRLVTGTSIAQTYQFVETGNAPIGLVALSQVIGHERGSRWLVDAALHQRIAQDAVLLARAAAAPAARAFLRFLGGAEARAIIRRYGYETVD